METQCGARQARIRAERDDSTNRSLGETVDCKIAASILAADFGHLADQVAAADAGGANWIHVDVMDGHFVPNITIGPLVVRAVRGVTALPLDVHLMIERPERYLGEFAAAGADLLTVHVETCPHVHRTIQRIGDLGCRAGVSLNPATPLVHLEPVLRDVDLVLVLAVDPGFGGQSYIPASSARIARLRRMLETCGRSDVELEVDGGVKPHNAAEIVEAGATVLVAGSAVFGGGASIGQNITALRQGIRRASDTHSARGRS